MTTTDMEHDAMMELMLLMPKLATEHGMDKAMQILECVGEILKPCRNFPKDVFAESFAIIVGIGNDALKKGGA